MAPYASGEPITGPASVGGLVTAKRDSDNCDRFIRDLRGRVLGAPSTALPAGDPRCLRQPLGARGGQRVGCEKPAGINADQNRRSAGQRATGLFAISAEENAGSPPLFATSVLV
jgi:hypothetical protein